MQKSILFLSTAILLAGCDKPADVASRNLSQAADNFEIVRRITFINGFTDKAELVMEGRCALDINRPKILTVTCRTGASEYKKNYLGLSDNMTYIAEQLEESPASIYRYRVTFNPSTIIPDINLAK